MAESTRGQGKKSFRVTLQLRPGLLNQFPSERPSSHVTLLLRPAHLSRFPSSGRHTTASDSKSWTVQGQPHDLLHTQRDTHQRAAQPHTYPQSRPVYTDRTATALGLVGNPSLIDMLIRLVSNLVALGARDGGTTSYQGMADTEAARAVAARRSLVAARAPQMPTRARDASHPAYHRLKEGFGFPVTAENVPFATDPSFTEGRYYWDQGIGFHPHVFPPETRSGHPTIPAIPGDSSFEIENGAIRFLILIPRL